MSTYEWKMVFVFKQLYYRKWTALNRNWKISEWELISADLLCDFNPGIATLLSSISAKLDLHSLELLHENLVRIFQVLGKILRDFLVAKFFCMKLPICLNFQNFWKSFSACMDSTFKFSLQCQLAELLQLCQEFLEIVCCGMRVVWIKLCAKIPKICQICAVTLDYAGEKTINTRNEFNSNHYYNTNISCLIVSDLRDAFSLCCNRWRYVQHMKKTPRKIYKFFRFLKEQAGLPRIHPRNP